MNAPADFLKSREWVDVPAAQRKRRQHKFMQCLVKLTYFTEMLHDSYMQSRPALFIQEDVVR